MKNIDLNNGVFDKLAVSIPQNERKALLEKLQTSDVEITEDVIKDEAKRIAFLKKIGYNVPQQQTSDNIIDARLGVVRKRSILIVDDNVISLRTFMNVLKDDYRVSVVKSGAEALTFLTKKTPDLILLDYEMPVMDGVETIRLIRKEESTKDIPVFFLTAVTDAEWIKTALLQKPNGYILKTISNEDLKKRINDFFDEGK